MKHANWNWNDGTPEDGPRPADMSNTKPEKKSWNGMNILDYIDWLMEQGISEQNAEEIASNEFNLN